MMVLDGYNNILQQAQREWSPVSQVIVVNSIWWVKVGVERIKNQKTKNKKQKRKKIKKRIKELRCIPPVCKQWGSVQ